MPSQGSARGKVNGSQEYGRFNEKEICDEKVDPDHGVADGRGGMRRRSERKL